ncbi:MAG: IS630 family transposase [Prochloraceae cyanobacterium]|nr:IS630 family transposase [Prochloraceae cyanobacterium]
MKQQKTALNYAKVQALYLIKIKAVETVRYLAVNMVRSESTTHSWLQLYREGGLEKLLETPPKVGRTKKLDVETVAEIQKELSDPEGFNSYKEIQLCLYSCHDRYISYSSIHRIVRYELKSKLKVPRPTHEKQEPGVIEGFKNYLPTLLKGLINEFRQKTDDKRDITYWCQDETRLGVRTISGKKITLKGVKPQQIKQWSYKYYYIYGLIEPVRGQSFFYEFSHLNGDCFEIYLEKFAEEYPENIHIIQLDNAPFHTAQELEIPDNIILFQPPYCPELNPIERLWEYIKYELRSTLFIDLEELKEKTANILNSLSQEIIQSLTSWDHILDALSI